jgi:hypothetical protein
MRSIFGTRQRLVPVLRLADLLQEERQVLPFGEASQLRKIVEPDIEQTPDAHALQNAEELLCRLLSETGLPPSSLPKYTYSKPAARRDLARSSRSKVEA